MKSFFKSIFSKLRKRNAASGSSSSAHDDSDQLLKKQSYKSAGDFGYLLFKYCLDKNETSNCVISPVSVFLSMSMLKRGANGETKAELDQALFTSPESSGSEGLDVMKKLICSCDSYFKLTTANGLFLQDGLEPLDDFVSAMERDFKANVTVIDFGSLEGVNQVNAWVEEETNGKITEMISQPDNSTIMSVINAVHMKGSWFEPFDQVKTTVGDFRVSETKTVRAHLMQTEKYFPFHCNKDKNFMLTFIPYLPENDNGRCFWSCRFEWEMGILLPDFGSDPVDFIDYLQHDSLTELSEDSHHELINVKLPKFRVEASVDLVSIMKQMGVESAFTDQADFPKISCK